MARQLGFGRISGKVGDLVYSSYKGKSYVKSAPNKSTKPKTEKQIAHQAKFALAVRFLKPVIAELNAAFKLPGKAASGYNLALKHTLEHVIKGEYPDYTLNYAEARFSRGGWSAPAWVHLVPGAACLMIIWMGDQYRDCSYGDDEVNILIYEPESGEYIKGPSHVYRAQEACIIAIPESFGGKVLHTYLFCVSASGKRSASVYAGEVIV